MKTGATLILVCLALVNQSEAWSFRDWWSDSVVPTFKGWFSKPEPKETELISIDEDDSYFNVAHDLQMIHLAPFALSSSGENDTNSPTYPPITAYDSETDYLATQPTSRINEEQGLMQLDEYYQHP